MLSKYDNWLTYQGENSTGLTDLWGQEVDAHTEYYDTPDGLVRYDQILEYVAEVFNIKTFDEKGNEI